MDVPCAHRVIGRPLGTVVLYAVYSAARDAAGQSLDLAVGGVCNRLLDVALFSEEYVVMRLSASARSWWAVGCSAFLLAGCGTKLAAPPVKGIAARAANSGQVELHVKDMCQRLNIV
jgi:hypothetical protein